MDTKEIGQTTTYANILGAPYAALTNGDRWLLYDIFEQAKIEDRLIFGISVSSAEPHEAARSLLALWHPNASAKQRRKAEHAPERRHTRNSDGPLPPPAPQPDDRWVALPEFQGKKFDKPLSPIRLPDGSELPVKHWKDLLTGVVRWLVRKGSLPRNLIPIPVAPNSTRYVLNTEACHQNGKMMGEPEQIGQNLWVETWGNQDTIRGHTALVLRHCGEDPRKLQLQKKQ